MSKLEPEAGQVPNEYQPGTTKKFEIPRSKRVRKKVLDFLEIGEGPCVDLGAHSRFALKDILFIWVVFSPLEIPPG